MKCDFSAMVVSVWIALHSLTFGLGPSAESHVV